MIGFEITLDDKKHDAILFSDGGIYINNQAQSYDPAGNYYGCEEELRLAHPEAVVRIIGPVCDLSQMRQNLENDYQDGTKALNSSLKELERRYEETKGHIDELEKSVK